MKNKPKTSLSPISDSLSSEYVFVDSEICESIKNLKFWKYVSRFITLKEANNNQRQYSTKQIILTLLLWPLLNSKSMNSFLGNLISNFFSGGKDVLYDFQARQDINWRNISMCISKENYDKLKLKNEQEIAFVVDDTIKNRRGKKVEGVSSHFCHTNGKQVMGQQILHLGLSWKEGFLPVDSQIFIGSAKVHPLNSDFLDGRSAVAKDYNSALNNTKHEQLEDMVKRAQRMGINAKYILGDTWFGCRKNIKLAINQDLIGIFRMRKGNLKYKYEGALFSLNQLYLKVKKDLKKGDSKQWKVTSLKVDLNISEDNKVEEWVKVRLVFSSPLNPKKDEWAAFLCSDTRVTSEKVLEIYALRWGIEVFFKELKQNLGFLKEQTGNYASHYASIHLTTIRYLLLFYSMKIRGADCFGKNRDSITGKLEFICFAAFLWELFKAIIWGILDTFVNIDRENIENLKSLIETSILDFFEKALQLDTGYLKSERKAEKLKELV